MPQPPILPVLDWKSIFESGKDWPAWLDSAEHSEHRARMEAILADFRMPGSAAARIANLARSVHVVAIAEDWCGDVVRHAPILRALEQASSAIAVRFITRAQHPDVFARLLTNGGEAIPKFVFLGAAWTECGNWGPMPEECRRLIARGKACGDVGAARKKVSALYDADPGCAVVAEELAALAEIAGCSEP